jgi:2-polyprenyl-3-methyl-5-hydroxy-6-metoxy-1,4-benzoquinol methylase
MQVDCRNRALKKCSVCGRELRYLLDGYDFLCKTTGKKFRVYKCTNCEVEQVMPIPTQKEIRFFYPGSYYSYNVKKVESTKKGFFMNIRDKIVDLSYNKKSSKNIYYYLALISKPFFSGLPLKNMGDNNFLDIGCGDGYNLDLMAKYGWNCYGFEIGEKKKIKNIYYDFSLANINFNNLKFDYIRIWHVLEHVTNPVKFMEHVASLLSNKGKIVIGIPNTKSLYATLFGKYWYNRDIPRHVVNYNKNNLEVLLNKYNLKITNIKYMSTGGFLGSLQYFINDKLNLNIRLINKTLFVLLTYPLDIVCNLLKIGDCISLTVKHNHE